MNLNELITDVVENSPPRILLHSIRGLGKTTWAAKAPNPILIQTETGLGLVKVNHFPLAKTTDEFFRYIDHLVDSQHNYRTLIIDTIDWVERLFWQTVCNETGYETIVDKGLDFGTGYKKAMVYHNKLIEKINILWEKKRMAIILLSHTATKTYNNPVGADYTQYVLKLHHFASDLYEELFDAIIFLNHKTYVTETKDLISQNKAIGSGERSFFTENRPAFAAKNRWGLPYEIPFKKGDGFIDFLKIIKECKQKANQTI